eukprot:SAG22_NODE_18962_length_279_cov_1.072222_1_plen_56_part_10
MHVQVAWPQRALTDRACCCFLQVPLLHYESDGKGPSRVGLAHPTIHPYGVYSTQDP